MRTCDTRVVRAVEAQGLVERLFVQRVHGEWVENAEDIRPALERAAASGKPALVNVKVDPKAASSTAMGLH